MTLIILFVARCCQIECAIPVEIVLAGFINNKKLAEMKNVCLAQGTIAKKGKNPSEKNLQNYTPKYRRHCRFCSTRLGRPIKTSI